MDVPLYCGNVLEAGGIATATSSGTTLTAGSVNTKGSWVPLVASMPDGITGFWLKVSSSSAYKNMLDVGVGAGPTVVVNNFFWNGRPGCVPNHAFFPIALPSGQALSVRMQSGSSSATVYASVMFERTCFGSGRGLSTSTTYGATTSTTMGMLLDPGSVANTKPTSWTEITSATTSNIEAFLLAFGVAYDGSGALYGLQNWLIDIGIGPVGSETAILPNLPVSCDSSSDTINGAVFGPVSVLIPAGTRLSARAQCNVTDATYRTIRFVFIGMA